MGSQTSGLSPNSAGKYFQIQGCAAGVTVWKLVPLDDCACDQSVKYVDESGNVTTTAPAGWVGGECSAPDSLVLNRHARFVLAITGDINVPAGGTFDLTPNVQQLNTFPAGMIFHDPVANVIKFANTLQLNIQQRVFFNLSTGVLTPYDIGLQRGNETTPIATTRLPVFRRPANGGEVSGPTVATINTFTSGPTDPFNLVGVKTIFINPTGQNVRIIAGEIRHDFFAVI